LLNLTDGSLVALKAESRLLFSRMDREDNPDLTVLTLETGSLLVNQSTTGDIIEIRDEDDNLLATVVRMGTLAVSKVNGTITVSCFSGSCLYGDGQPLTGEMEVELSLTGELLTTNSITEDRKTSWQMICSECWPEGE
jgi:hypothetical protein